MAELTIITVVKNNLEGLKGTYESLMSQENQDFLWMVVDGQSTDGTLPWLSSVDRKGFCFTSGKDRSLFDAMNKAVGRLETEYCLFLNGGDRFWDAKVTDRLLAALAQERFLIGYGKYVLGAVPGFPERERGRRIRTLLDMFHGPVPCHQTMIISKRAFSENGPYREDVGIYGDAEWILRYSKRRHPSTFTYLPTIICHYHPEGVSYNRFFKNGRTYHRMLRKTGNAVEYLAGAAGWLKTAAYVLISKGLGRIRNAEGS